MHCWGERVDRVNDKTYSVCINVIFSDFFVCIISSLKELKKTYSNVPLSFIELAMLLLKGKLSLLVLTPAFSKKFPSLKFNNNSKPASRKLIHPLFDLF